MLDLFGLRPAGNGLLALLTDPQSHFAAAFASVALLMLAAMPIWRARLRAKRAMRDGLADPSQTITDAIRGLRLRYIIVMAALIVPGTLFVLGAHYANGRFANATSMAVLVAEATEVVERAARTAIEMSGRTVRREFWGEKALEVHARRLGDVLAVKKASQPTVSWSQDGTRREIRTDEPTRAVAELSAAGAHGVEFLAKSTLPVNGVLSTFATAQFPRLGHEWVL
jgi:hypothetical protein